VSEYGGAVNGYETVLHLSNTRWMNNSANYGGAIYLYWGQATLLRGTNYFFYNTAAVAGGAVYGEYESYLWVDSTQLVTTGNTAGGNSSNFYISPMGALQFEAGQTAPPYTIGPSKPFPKFYVDAKANCSQKTCNGSETHPWGNLGNATNHMLGTGGTIFVMPGIYLGPENRQLYFQDTDATFRKWPLATGEVIIDCQNAGWGLNSSNLELTIYDITFQNCHTTNETGGGAIQATESRLRLIGVKFINNSATTYGGAITLFTSQLNIAGGKFEGNSATLQGGAMMIQSSIVHFLDDVQFIGNTVGTSSDQRHSQDVACVNANVQNSGESSFTVADANDCSISASTADVTAVFPGSLEGKLFPKNAAGGIDTNEFAALQFHSVVELDEYGSPIESTRLMKSDMIWTLTVTNQTNYIVLEYDAFGVDNNEFIAITHTFFLQSSLFDVIGLKQPLNVSAGTIKTSIEVALWNFQAALNSLRLTLETTSSSPIEEITNQTAPDDSTEFLIRTSTLTFFFSALPIAVYDSITNVGQVILRSPIQDPLDDSRLCFEFDFEYFDLWMHYDPQFGVVFSQSSGDSGSGDNLVPLWALTALIIIPGCMALSVGLYCGVRWVRWKRKTRSTEKQVNFTYSLLSEDEGEQGI